MRTPLAATRGAPQKEAMPPTHATASESFTLQSRHPLLGSGTGFPAEQMLVFRQHGAAQVDCSSWT